MKVEIWSDFACPFCYIGKKRFESALGQFAHKDQVEVVFKSFELDPTAPIQVEHDIHEMLATKYGMSRERAIAMNEQLGSQAKEVGLNFHFDGMKLTNMFDAHRLAQYAAKAGKSNEAIMALFNAYFTDSRHLGDRETLLELAVEIGLDRADVEQMLDGDDFTQEVRSDEAEAKQLGVSGVPFFVIDRKYAVSGAQPDETFLRALDKAYQESQPLQVLNQDQSAPGCDDGSCSV